MEWFMAGLIGIGLSAAAGFRVFTPLFIASLASYLDWVELSSTFDWMGTLPALIAFGVATLVEVGAYYLPVIYNFLSVLAAPAAAIAGVLLTASFLTDGSPLLTWAIAIIAGGGAATLTNAASGTARVASTATTAGIANPALSVAEDVTAVTVSILSIFVPILALILVIVAVFFIWRIRRKRRVAV